MSAYCPLDGANRHLIYQEPTYVVWQCDYCGHICDEDIKPGEDPH